MVDVLDGGGYGISLAVVDGVPAICSQRGSSLHYSTSATPRGTSADDWTSVTVCDYNDTSGQDCSLAVVDGQFRRAVQAALEAENARLREQVRQLLDLLLGKKVERR